MKMIFFLWCVRKQSYLCSENKGIITTNGYQTGSELNFKKGKKIMVTLMIILAVVAASISLAVNVNDRISMGL
jgi:hypothetical protein